MKKEVSERRYLARQIAVPVVAAIALSSVVKGGEALESRTAHRLSELYSVPNVVPVDSKHKDIILGQKYVVKGKEIVPTNMDDVAEVAAVPGFTVPNEATMLTNELKDRGIDPETAQAGTVVYVQPNAVNGPVSNQE